MNSKIMVHSKESIDQMLVCLILAPLSEAQGCRYSANKGKDQRLKVTMRTIWMTQVRKVITRVKSTKVIKCEGILLFCAKTKIKEYWGNQLEYLILLSLARISGY